ncbi:DUF1987 domain-containing protein [Algivirga pacifica]|uniref:SiaC family regulatory phosphoprotein domain-containing protein n=1 Tax=Algivirga pacifica TaxID=1162670 RepID=A0ABP9D4L9_9BACT
MLNLTLKETNTTPYVRFHTSGKLEISGKSLPDIAAIFYDPILEWIEDYCQQLPNETKITIGLSYLNTATMHYIKEIIIHLAEAYEDKPGKLHIIWEIDEEDEDLMELVDIFQSLLSIKIKTVLL